MKKIFVVGSLNMDLTIRTGKMPAAGMTVTGEGFMTNPGGKGANQAVAVSKLGGNAYMVGCTGTAFGEELRSTLCGYGVHTQYVRPCEGVSSGIAVIVVAEGDNRIILDEGANALADKQLVDNALAEAKEGDFLICQLEIPVPVVEYALRCAKQKGMITILNPAPAKKLSESVFRYIDYFVPNQSEAEFYAGIRPEGEENVRACMDKLRQFGAENVLITLGEEGSACLCKEGFVRAACVKVPVVDTTAAGDTYVGAFAVRLSEGASVQEAMNFASKASALAVTKRGAQQSVPTREEVEK